MNINFKEFSMLIDDNDFNESLQNDLIEKFNVKRIDKEVIQCTIEQQPYIEKFIKMMKDAYILKLISMKLTKF